MASVPHLDSGIIDLVGDGFVPNTRVYAVLYNVAVYYDGENYVEKFTWISTQGVTSNDEGMIYAVLGGAGFNQTFVVVALTNPYVRLSSSMKMVPHDRFVVSWVGQNQKESECPNAPPQRMYVGKRGVVCTLEDSLQLKDAPRISAGKINSLTPNSIFTVTGGPICSENWSWWQIKTDAGDEGWIAEGGDMVDPYFICPMDQ